MSGQTLLECQNVMMREGAREVSVYATHGVFPDKSWKRFIDTGFPHFWITNSCPKSVASVEWKSPFEILSLAPIIAHEIANAT